MGHRRRYHRGRGAALLGTVVLVVGSACTQGDGDTSVSPDFPTSEPIVVSTEGVAEAQHWALEDGEVTRVEYEQGFEDFAGCAEKEGVPLNRMGTDPATGLIRYNYSAEPVDAAVAERCYREFWSEIDAVFQTTDPETVAAVLEDQLRFFETEIRPCLEANGYEGPEVVDPNSTETGAAVDQWAVLMGEGRCRTE